MLLRQLFYHPTFGYTYLLADDKAQEGILIDPVKARMRDYVQIFNELGLTLTAAIDTHSHEDHESAQADLRALWNCETILGGPDETADYTRIVGHGDTIDIGGLRLEVLHTPGYTMDSHCFYLRHPVNPMVFTGDTLLVRTVGLSNRATSNPKQHFHSLYWVLAELPDDTIVYPGRDFKGWPMSTIREEKAFNPYLQADNLEEFLTLKAHQKPADIRPLTAHRDDAGYEPATKIAEPALGMTFHLPEKQRLRSIDSNIEAGETNLTSWR
jgi:glyoxylase-like metal-dependent hydrolase (beta-lactamase superfamily II)